jgi:hypothetical protein
MSVLIQGSQIRAITLGVKVDRATAVLPATAQAAIFTITGGRVVVTSLVGEFTVAGSATATNLSVTTNPTTGTDVVLASVAAVASKEIGSLVTLPLTLGGTLNVQSAGAGEIPGAVGFLCPIGTIELITSATNTGSVKWSLTYYPYDDGAAVAAA